MGTTARASVDDLAKLEMTIRIRDRIVRITAEELVAAVDEGRDVDEHLGRLRDALAEAAVADDAFSLAAYGIPTRGRAAL